MRGEETAFLVVDIEFHLFGFLLVGHLVGEGVGELHIIGIGELQVASAGGQVFADRVARKEACTEERQER